MPSVLTFNNSFAERRAAALPFYDRLIDEAFRVDEFKVDRDQRVGIGRDIRTGIDRTEPTTGAPVSFRYLWVVPFDAVSAASAAISGASCNKSEDSLGERFASLIFTKSASEVSVSAMT